VVYSNIQRFNLDLMSEVENDVGGSCDLSRSGSEQVFCEDDLSLSMGEVAIRIAALWDAEGTFQKLQELRANSPLYRIFDGPPFATGMPHYGHFLPMALKDWAFRYHSMKGEKASMRGGWDTHGLPIEALIQKEQNLQTTEDIEEMGIPEFSEACRATVLRYVKEWNATQRSMGRWIDMTDPYATMDADYIESVWWVFAQLFEKGLVYEGKQVVAYSPGLATPLSNFEADQNYIDIEDPSVTVAFELDDGSKMLAWTTTPWSLPGNLALAVGLEIDYVKVNIGGEMFFLAKERLSVLEGKEYSVKGEMKGSELVGMSYSPLFDHFREGEGVRNAFKVVASNHVTLDSGTGIVHIAPAYGEDDFFVGEANGLGLVDPIDSKGEFNAQIPNLSGMNFRDANPKVLEMLESQGCLFEQNTITHSYPHCYRTDKPLLYKAVPSWFIKVTDIKDRMAELNQDINWMPDHLKDGRFGNWLSNARDWSISRNRYWGAPLPIWRCEETGEIIVIGSRDQLFELTGERPDDLHKAVMDDIPIEKDGKIYNRVPEIFDCWFESGAMPYASLHYPFEEGQSEENPPVPADFIAEGLDQTRGWFYTLMVLSTALYDKPAFKNVVVNGMVLAENDEQKWVKMSKKLRNYPDPNDLMERVGGDAMRFFILNSGAAKAEPLKFSEDGVDQTVKKVLLPLWNIYKFFVLYANADEWKGEVGLRDNVQQGKCEFPSESVLDKWVLARLEKSHEEITAAFDVNDLPRALREYTFLMADISQWYVRLSRSRFWKSEGNDKASAYRTLYEVLVRCAQMIAPVCPFISESIYRSLTKEESVHHSLWPQANAKNKNPELLAEMEAVRKVISLGLFLRKSKRLRVRQPLAEIAIVQKQGIDLSDYIDLIKAELNIKNVRFIEERDEEVFKPLVNLNRARLGKKLRAGLKKVIVALAQGAYELRDGELKIDEYELSEEAGDFSVNYVASGAGIADSKDGFTVVLDTEITEELEMEGMARDLIRVIQRERKEKDLHITDRIRVEVVSSDEKVGGIVEGFRSMIAEAVLGTEIAVRIEKGEEIEYECKIGDLEFRLSIWKVFLEEKKI
jgi:isoleucyl-tRNA synthetase